MVKLILFKCYRTNFSLPNYLNLSFLSLIYRIVNHIFGQIKNLEMEIIMDKVREVWKFIYKYILKFIAGPIVLIGIIFIAVSKLLASQGQEKPKDLIRRELHKEKQKEKENEIKSAEERSTVVAVNIKESEKVSEELKVKIQKVAEKAAKDVEKIKDMGDDLEKVDSYIQERWGDI